MTKSMMCNGEEIEDKINDGIKKMLKSVEKPFMKAAERRREIGEETDKILLRIIRENPRLSLYELAQEVNWGVGKVDGSVKRLLRDGKIKEEYFVRNGRRVKLVSSIEYEPSANVFEIPKEAVNRNFSWWNEAFVYGLDRLTIGVSGRAVDEWEERAFLKAKVSVKQIEGSFIFKLPKKFVDFYALEKTIIGISIVKDLVLLTMEGRMT